MSKQTAHIGDLPKELQKKLKAENPALRKSRDTVDADQARRLAARIMVALTADADNKATQRKALALAATWLKVR